MPGLRGCSSLTAGAGNLTLGNGTQVPVTSTMSGQTMHVTATLGTGKVIHGTGVMAGMGTIAGTFTGPGAGDSGVWTADIAATTVNFGVTGTIDKGPDTGKNVLIGDLLGYVDAIGVMHGTYVDNSKVGPGITPKTYPVHGSYINKMITASIAFSTKTSFALVGRAGTFFGGAFTGARGAMYGPTSLDSGTWAGVAQ